MATPPYDPTITETLQTVAELIVLKPKEDWASWIAFLLNEMKSVMPAQAYAGMLAQLQEELARQLAEMAS